MEEERENDEMIERSMLRGGVGETRGVELPKIVRRRVGDGVNISVGNSSRVQVWRWVCDNVADAVLSVSWRAIGTVVAGSRMSAGT